MKRRNTRRNTMRNTRRNTRHVARLGRKRLRGGNMDFDGIVASNTPERWFGAREDQVEAVKRYRDLGVFAERKIELTSNKYYYVRNSTKGWQIQDRTSPHLWRKFCFLNENCRWNEPDMP